MVPDPVRLGLLPHAPQRSWQEVSWPRTQYKTACSPGHPLSPAAPSPAEDDHPPSRARRPVGSGSGAPLGRIQNRSPSRRNVWTPKRLLVPHPDALLSSEFDTTSSYLEGNRQNETLFAWPRRMSTYHAFVSDILHSFT